MTSPGSDDNHEQAVKKYLDASAPDALCETLIDEIRQPDTLMTKKKHEQLGFVYSLDNYKNISHNGYFAFRAGIDEWKKLSPKKQISFRPPEATLKWYGRVSETQVGEYADARAADKVTQDIQLELTALMLYTDG